MNKILNDNPFIKNLEKDDIEDLIKDNQLRKDKVNIYFVVDTYDIIEYCFPFQADNKREEYELKTKLIAYEYLFFDTASKPIVPDEYLAELNSFMHSLKTSTDNAIDAFKDIEKLFKEEKNGKIDLDFFSKNITTFLAIQYDLLSPDSLKRYQEIYNDRLDIFDISVPNKHDKEVLLNLFLNTKKSDLSKEIFEDYYDEVKYKFIKQNSNSDDIFRNLNNTYKDIIVIDRLIQINNSLEEKNRQGELKEKYLFLYVSSTPTKSKILFDLPSINNNLPDLYGYKSFNFLRNAPQIYLQAISNFSDHQREDDIINFLKQIVANQESIDSIHHLEEEVQETDSDFIKKLADMRLTTRNQFDIVSKMNRFYDNKDKLTQVIDDLKNSSGTNSKAFLRFKEYLGEIGKSKEFKRKSSQVSEYLYLHTANSELQNKILELKMSDKDIIPDFGEDIVRSEYQHLPILIFYRRQTILSKTLWSDLLKTISHYLLEPKKEDKEKFISAYEKIIRNVERKKSTSPIEVSVILYYLSLILPDSKTGNEKHLIYQLENLKEIIEFSSIKQEYDAEKKSFNQRRVDSKYKLEINYLLIWLYRRKKMFDESIALADETLKVYKNDPRIIHGKALAIIAKAYPKREDEDISKELLMSKDLLEEASILYELEDVEKNILIRKTLIAISNGVCYSYNNLFSLKRDKKYLKKAKKASTEFMRRFNKFSDKPITEFPAFCDNLCWLNLFLSEEALEKNNIKEATTYYTQADRYFEVCKNNPEVYEGLEASHFNDFKSRLKSLKNEVIKQS
ncbi:hypothetical protein [Tenacibaculum agarivorans]|uniref:hypothetical protein n=1 Tax=Tenacibaculum agarivorans TaxID=1908389 RepID=UPI00094BA874|nr:hypothetical protein [Tenacibaculum agarivorans]